MSQNRKSNLEDANLDNKSSTINLEDKNLNEQYDLLAVLNVPQKEPYVERTKWQSFKNFVNFLVFDVKWFMVFYHSFLFLGFLYSAITSIYILLFLPLTDEWLRMLLTWFFAFVLTTLGGIGLSAGAHRLWSHHAFKANFLLRVALALMYTLTAEGSLLSFVRYHRLHHKYIDTLADPQNINRGMFYAQIGWRLQHKHPEYKKRIKGLSYDDIYKDKVVMFHWKYYLIIVIIVAWVIPVAIPMLLWNETFINALLICGCTKSFLAIHMHGLVGSVCHTFGVRTYNNKISATDNKFIQYFVIGEAYHNFHHTFPYDYAICELGKTFNFTKWFIDVAAYFGFAKDLRTAGIDYVKKAKETASSINPICYTFE